MTTAYALPAELQHLAGKVVDVDSHEMMEIHEWVPEFGPDVQPLVDEWLNNGHTAETDKNHPHVPGYTGDDQPITSDVVNQKGCWAPGAYDSDRRLEVMDAMGVARQLMFPGGVGLYSTILHARAHDAAIFPSIQGDRAAIAQRWISLYQDWLVKFAERTERICPVAPVVEPTVEELLATTKRLIDAGIRSILVPVGTPLAGRSPAHSDLDPFWELLADANCSFSLHIGADGKFLDSAEWGNAEAFEGFRALGEFSVDPWSLSVLHLPFQNFITTLVTGGVFARHPDLRVGVYEVGSHWVGPMVEGMDIWHRSMGHMNNNPHKLTQLPSDYVRQNVRVTPYPFEPIATFIERHDLGDVLCFSTDYPHVEGGKSAAKQMLDEVSRLGPEAIEKFFVHNGAWVLPPR